MIIFCCGMSRSGSTVQYQIVKQVMEATGVTFDLAGLHPHSWSIRKIKAHYDKSNIIMKSEQCHDWQIELLNQDRAIGIGIYRDYRDVVASLMKFYGKRYEYFRDVERTGAFEEVIEQSGAQALRWQSAWEAQPNVTFFRYEDYWPQLGYGMPEQITNILSVKLNKLQLLDIGANTTIKSNLSRIDSMDEWIDTNDSLLTTAHISRRRGEPGSYVYVLDRDQRMQVEDIAGDWLKDHGYEV